MPVLKAWRLSMGRYAQAALTGEGSRILGGRWNSAGLPVVYSSLSLSLAVLEVFVHMTSPAGPEDYVSTAVSLPIKEADAERVDLDRLPDDWRLVNHPVLRAIGDDWALSQRSLVLLVPSVIVDGEWNAVINPLHPDAGLMVVENSKPFHFDERMFKVRR